MGYDIYGLNPKQLVEKPQLLTDLLDKDGCTNYDVYEKLSKEEQENYWKVRQEHEDSNPGIYFRNNIWWWRPLWNYVCEVCEEVMSDDDIEAGQSNSGDIINAETVDHMITKLNSEIMLRRHVDYEIAYNIRIGELPLMDCDYCDGTGTRHWDDGPQDCNVCNTEYTRKEGIPVGKEKSWESRYPFSAENVEEFVKFLEHSGGIQIS